MQRKKKPFLTLRNSIFKSPKDRFFFKRVNSSFWSKKTNYLVYLDLVKIRLAIMLSDFDEKKETFLTKGKKTFFSKGLSYAFGQNMPNSSLFRFGQNKTRTNG